jgi:hypothetical protein
MIPKVIHLLWIPDFSKAPKYALKNLAKWKKLNPDYSVLQWSEEKVLDIIPNERIDVFRSLDMPVKKADFGRLEIIKQFGGYYFDCDLVPNIPLNVFFNLKKIKSPYYDRKKNYRIRSVDCDISSKRLIFSREWKNAFPDNSSIFTAMNRIANGVIIAERESEEIESFLDFNCRKTDKKVLKYLGPHSLTNYFMMLAKKSKIDGLAVVPPHYFLWEKSLGNQPDWSVSAHPCENTWGDHSKKNYWDI